MIVDLMESKTLDLNDKKSECIVIGHEKARRKILSELAITPLTLADKPMQVVESDRYLGDQLSKTLTESVHQTVKKRIGLTSQSVYEIRAVVDDARAEAVGRLTVGFTIWETSVISMLLHNSEVWTEVGRKTIKLL